jgi:hypothetical protein
MSDEAGTPPTVDTSALVEQLRARVEQRKRDGDYPADLVEDLEGHFRRVTSNRAGPDVHSVQLRIDQLQHAANFSTTRIALDSGMPGGAKLHGLVAKAVSRQTVGILAQMQQFADAAVAALRVVLAEVDGPQSHVHAELVGQIDALFEHVAALERRVSAADGPVRLADPAEELRGCEPVLVIDDNPVARLEAVPDGSLGGLALIGAIEDLTPKQAADLARIARSKLRADGKVVLEEASPPIHPAYLRSLLEEAGFGSQDYAIAIR